jgi:hypothetical protein
MASIEEIKAEMRRLFIAGDKEDFLLYLEKILDKMTDVEGEELGEWFRGLTPGTVVDETGKSEKTVYDAAEIDAMDASPVIPETEREGVFVHSFKCLHCRLHFQTFSWLANRHGVGSVTCPECGGGDRLKHWRAKLSQTAEPESGGKEIRDLFPYPDSSEMADSWRNE